MDLNSDFSAKVRQSGAVSAMAEPKNIRLRNNASDPKMIPALGSNVNPRSTTRRATIGRAHRFGQRRGGEWLFTISAAGKGRGDHVNADRREHDSAENVEQSRFDKEAQFPARIDRQQC